MADLAYTTADDVTRLAGERAVELRTDDVDPAEVDALIAAAVAYASGRVDFYCSRYSQAELAANRWVRDVATLFALHWLCQRRLNPAAEGLEAERQERLEELQAIQQGKAQVPRAAASRRAVTVSNQRVDLGRANHQLRTDRSRSTGVAKDYPRRTDPGAEALGDR